MARQPDSDYDDCDRPLTLAAVVDLAFVRTGASSSRQLQDYAERNGFELTHSTINLIRKGTYPSRPKDKTLTALAFLAGMPVNPVRELAGLKPRVGPSFADQLPPDVDDLGPKPRAALIEMARTMLELQRRQADETHETGVSVASLADLGLSGQELRNESWIETRPSGG